MSAGISADINATAPEKTIEFEHFRYAGDGNYGNTNPAPEIPMLGRWADGLHTEPMEFGYDLTDLTDGYEASVDYVYVKDESGDIVVFADKTGIRRILSPENPKR